MHPSSLPIHDNWKWKLLSWFQLFETPWTIQSMELSRVEYWSGQPFPSPGDLPNPGIEPAISHIASRFFTKWAIRDTFYPPISTDNHWSTFLSRNLQELINTFLLPKPLTESRLISLVPFLPKVGAGDGEGVDGGSKFNNNHWENTNMVV